MEKLKVCLYCQEEKEINKFKTTKNINCLDGRKNVCIECDAFIRLFNNSEGEDRICLCCAEEKHEDDFYINTMGSRYHYCKICYGNSQKRHPKGYVPQPRKTGKTQSMLKNERIKTPSEKDNSSEIKLENKKYKNENKLLKGRIKELEEELQNTKVRMWTMENKLMVINQEVK